jgi:hypothetical protein
MSYFGSVDQCSRTFLPPSPPNPSADKGVLPEISSPNRNAPSPPAEADWDPFVMSPETAMKMLSRSVTALARATGEVLPTPPVVRPMPRIDGKENTSGSGRPKTSSRPATPVSADDMKAPSFLSVELGSPEACEHEPNVGGPNDVGANSEAVHLQQVAIARKFFSKRPPAISLEDYLLRLQRYCPMSTAVYLAAGVYIHKVAVEERLVPVTSRTAHRLVLAALRVAMKALEDLRYPQARFAGVGGVAEAELKTLEINLCYLTDFDLQVDGEVLYRKTLALQGAADHILAVRSKLPSTFEPRLPLRTRRNG